MAATFTLFVDGSVPKAADFNQLGQSALSNAEATFYDRIQTGEDRVQTGADRLAVHDDKLAVSTDRAAVETISGNFGDVDAAVTQAQAGASTATTQAALSTTARIAAEAARDTASALANMNADTTLGLAATAEGGYFSTPSTDPNWSAIIWRKVSGAAVDTGLRSTGGQAATQGFYPATDGATGATNVSPATLIPADAISLTGTLVGLSVYALNASGAAKALLLTKNGDGTYTLAASHDFTMVAGANAIAWPLAVTAGQYLAIYVTAGGIRYNATSGKTLTYINGLPTVSTAASGTSANVEMRMGWKVETGLLARVSVAEAATAGFAASLAGATVTQGVYPATNGANDTAPSGLSIFNQTPISAEGALSAVSVYSTVVAAAQLLVVSINDDGTLKLEQNKAVTLAVGVNTFTDWNPYCRAGWLVGLYSAGAQRYTAGGATGFYYTTGVPGDASAKTLAGGLVPRIGWTIQTGVSAAIPALGFTEPARAKTAEAVLQALIVGNTASLQAQVTGTVVSQGEYPAVSLGGLLAAGYTSFSLVPIAQDGVISALSTFVGPAGPGRLIVATKNGDNSFNMVSSRLVNFTAGLNTFTDWNPPVLAGQYIGVYTQSTDGASYSGAGGIGARYCLGLPTSSTATSSLGPTYRFAIGWQVSNGALRSSTQDRSLELLKASSDGKGLLTAADSTGVADSTTAFASAMLQHPQPYVPVGTYAVTSLPRSGTGLWGPGRVLVNGVRYPLPLAPNDYSLRLKIRSAFAQLASSGSPLVLVGDSLQAHFTASSLARHWFNQFEDLLNSESAPGSEPSTIVLRNDDGTTGETVDFYGITVSGGSNGSRGPVGKSVILAAGGYIEFTGAYSQVDVFYQQETGAGGLSFTYNGGAAYKTLAAAGATSLDKFSGPSATGQTASGTYRITATGSAVELTGLVRLAPTLAAGGTPRPIYCMRAAYGGYTGSSFTTARLDAILAQATGLAGGTALECIVALMTNDMLFGGAPRPATYEADLTRIVNKLYASGASRVTLMTPPRPKFSNWGSYYTAGQDFDTFLACAQRVSKATASPILALDQIDLIGEGLDAPDHLHWGDLMQDRVLDHFVRWRAAL